MAIARLFIASLLLALAACSHSATSAAPPSRSVLLIQINDIARSYILRFPPQYNGSAKIPLVILLHGATDSAAYAEKAYHFDEKADAEGFILALPDALGEYHVWNPFLTTDEKETPNNDLAFLTTLTESLIKTYAIDPKRVYIAGHSSGAMMTYRMIATRPDLFAAAGIVSGAVGDAGSLPVPKSPTPLIIFHGKQDANVPYGTAPSGNVARALAFWTRVNQCPAFPAESNRKVKTVQRDYYPSRLAGVDRPDIVLYSLDNGNHMWPGGNIMPKKDEQPVQDISATDLMWDFFKDHKKS